MNWLAAVLAFFLGLSRFRKGLVLLALACAVVVLYGSVRGAFADEPFVVPPGKTCACTCYKYTPSPSEETPV